MQNKIPFENLSDALEPYIGKATGFVIKEIMQRYSFPKWQDLSPMQRKTLADILLDQVLGTLSSAENKVVKSKIYSILDCNSYAEKVEYWE